MKLGEEGLNLIKVSEGLSLKAYVCPAGVLTIGYGHTKGVRFGDVISVEKAHQLLLEDVIWAEDAVNRSVKVELNQNQFDALVSFTFNLGEANLKKSTLLRLLNVGSYPEAAEEFLRWNRAGGVILRGLTKRRVAERKLFLTPMEHVEDETSEKTLLEKILDAIFKRR
jgi:lysozyme